MRLEIGSAYTFVFLIMLIPLLMALQLWGQPRAPRKAVAEDDPRGGVSDRSVEASIAAGARRGESESQTVR